MLRRTLNLGILAHVDAGKTTLTERLLYAAGVIDEIGSVDEGTTQTDTLALERQRGITIRSAVASFAIGDVDVNLVDTPGHPDFVAEVERVLAVLDGAVLVVSAVEGVQPQTRILMRALQRLRIPTLLFVNKIDRAGADVERVLGAIERRLAPQVVAMGAAAGLGTRAAEFAPFGPADPALVAGARAGELHPVFFGSALTGAGIGPLSAAIAELLPPCVGDVAAAPSGLVFKIDRDPAGGRVAYVRMFAGTLRTRDRVRFGRDGDAKITAIRVFSDGRDARRPAVVADEIAKLSGLAEVRVGDSIGEPVGRATAGEFPPPTLESVVAPVRPEERQRLRTALAELAEQDPLIDVRRDDERQEIAISLYGEVQKEVVEATLAHDYGVPAVFSETTTICVERPTGTGEAVELLNTPANPFHADLGLRIAPAAAGSGVDVRVDVDPREAPLYVFKTFASFVERMEHYFRRALERGVFGWRVTDCVVTVTRIGYSLADGPPSRRGPMPTARDLEQLVPLVLRRALEHAGTVVCEPTMRVLVELPADAVGAVVAAVARLGGSIEPPSPGAELVTVEAVLPTAHVADLRRQLPGLTRGEGVLESTFEGYEPVQGEPPVRR